MFNTKLSLIFVFLFCFHFALSQNGFQPNFRQISTESGHINHIMRDSEGYLWVSTQDGLLTYNGAQWEQFNHNRKDSFSISDNYVWLSFEDSRGNIWVGTFEGKLSRFDKKTRKFHVFENIKTDNGIRSIYQYHEDYLFIGSDEGIYKFNLDEEKYEYDDDFLNRQFELGLYHTSYIEPFSEEMLLVSGENGAYLLSLENLALQKLETNIGKPSKIGCLKKIGDSYVLSGDNSIYIAEFNSKTNQFDINKHHFLAENTAVSALLDIGNGIILIGTNVGLFTYNKIEETINNIPNNSVENNNGLNDKIVYSVCKIEEDLYWVGTKTRIYEFSTTPKRFQLIENKYLCNTSILGMMEDANNNLWIATRNGLGRIANFNSPKNQWKYYCYNKSNVEGFRNNYVLNIMLVDQELWLGYRGAGMSKFKLDENEDLKLIQVSKQLDSLTRNFSVSQIKKDKLGNLWFATSGNGIIRWNKENKTIKNFKRIVNQDESFSDNFVFDFEELFKDEMAIATAKGISSINLKTDEITRFYNDETDTTTLSGDFVMDFHQDKKGNKWVCTSGGLNLWKEDKTFASWTKSEGLPNDVIYRMESIDNQNWVSSNRGITQITYDNPLNLKFRTFTTEDGIANNEHNQFSSYYSKNGLMFFGGTNGITYFNPSQIKDNTTKAIPIIHQFKLFNEDASRLLKEHIAYTKEIHLSYNQNFLSFDLAALSYKNAHQNQFKYKMEGLSNEWISLGTRSYLSFNGLSPGNYTLLVKAANNDGVWNNEALKLKIIINKPLWNRWYAWLVYFLIVGGIILYIYQLKLNSIRKIALAKEEERNIIRERSARDFHDEAGTIITRLSLLAQYLRIQIGEDQKEITALQQLETNIQKLRSGMRDFIWVLDPSKDSWHSTIQKLNELGNQMFEHSGIHFTMISNDKESSNIQLESIQRRQLLLIVKEGMNNILKHSEAKNCTLEVQNDLKLVKIILQDDGKGIPESNLNNGFGLKNLNDRAKKIKGKLTILNKKGGGTSLECTFPIHPNGL